jgi:hypothetical protein
MVVFECHLDGRHFHQNLYFYHLEKIIESLVEMLCIHLLLFQDTSEPLVAL